MFQMTYIVLPGMVHRHRGVILNLSSTAAVFPMPFLNVYSCTKVRQLSVPFKLEKIVVLLTINS